MVARAYERIGAAEEAPTPQLEGYRHLSYFRFPHVYMLALALLDPEDAPNIEEAKLALVGAFTEIWVARRLHSSLKFASVGLRSRFFELARDLRRSTLPTCLDGLQSELAGKSGTFNWLPSLTLNSKSRTRIRYLLARFTAYLEHESGVSSSFDQYVRSDITNPFEIEHVLPARGNWGDDQTGVPPRYKHMIGNLVLIPHRINQSYGAQPYLAKLPAYFGQNLLTRSLSPQCYKNNPGFLAFARRSGLPFKGYGDRFGATEIEERGLLYRELAKQIWNPSLLDEIVASVINTAW
jgi:hypothetical protein